MTAAVHPQSALGPTVTEVSRAAVLSRVIKAGNPLGKPLFVRKPRSVIPTQDGEVLLTFARRMLALRAEAWAAVVRPDVTGRVVIGVPDDELGESVKAVVEVDDGAVADEGLAEELIAFCRERLASYKCPRSVDFRDHLPRTETGKLQKRDVRNDYWAAAGRSV